MAAKRVDNNQAEIVQALRDVGASVQCIHTVGGGCPDIIVGHRGVNLLMEIKSEKGKLNIAESEWHRNWRGHVYIVRSVDIALECLKGIE